MTGSATAPPIDWRGVLPPMGAISLPIQQGSWAWKQWRNDGLGGSDIPALLGVSPYVTVEQLLTEKVDGSERKTNFAMRRGNRLEPEAREAYERIAGERFPPCCFQRIEHGFQWMKCSADGFKGQKAIEIKCPKWQFHCSALAGIIPAFNRWQLCWNWLVSGAETIDYVSFNNSSKFNESEWLAVIPYLPTREELAFMMGEVQRFWRRVISLRMIDNGGGG